MRKAKAFKPRVLLEKGWEALGMYTRIGGSTVVVRRAGDWLEKGQLLQDVYWVVWRDAWERGGSAKNWGAAVKAAKWWAAYLNHVEDETRPKPRGRAPKTWRPAA